MNTRRWLVWGLLAAGLLPAQDPQPYVQITGAVKQALDLSADRCSARSGGSGWLYRRTNRERARSAC